MLGSRQQRLRTPERAEQRRASEIVGEERSAKSPARHPRRCESPQRGQKCPRQAAQANSMLSQAISPPSNGIAKGSNGALRARPLDLSRTTPLSAGARPVLELVGASFALS